MNIHLKKMNYQTEEIDIKNLDHLGIVAGIIDDIGIVDKIIGLTQLAYSSCRVCDAVKISERKNQTYSVTHQPPIVTLA